MGALPKQRTSHARGGRIITWTCHSWSFAHSARNHGFRITPALTVGPIVGARSFIQKQIKSK